MVQHLARDHTVSLGKARERSQVSAGREHPLPGEGGREGARSQSMGPRGSPSPSPHPKLQAGPCIAHLPPMTPNTPLAIPAGAAETSLAERGSLTKFKCTSLDSVPSSA